MPTARAAVESFADDPASRVGDRLSAASVRGPRRGPWSLMVGYPYVEVVVALGGEVRPAREIDHLLDPVTAAVERDGLFFVAVPVGETDRDETSCVETVRAEGHPLPEAPVTGDVPPAIPPDAGPPVVDEPKAYLARRHLDSARTLLAYGGAERPPAETFADAAPLAGTAWFGRVLGRATRRTAPDSDPDAWVRVAAVAGLAALAAALDASGVLVMGDWTTKCGSVVAFVHVLGDDPGAPPRDAVSGLVRLVLMDRQVHAFDEVHPVPAGGEDRPGKERARRFTAEEADDALRVARELVDGLAPLVEELDWGRGTRLGSRNSTGTEELDREVTDHRAVGGPP